MTARPRFSIVVPFYCAEAYLEACVQSVAAQGVGDVEIILVDDGSTDESGRMADRLAERDSRIRVLHKENGGQDSARKQGTRLAGGEYLIYLDSDDRLAPGSLAAADERLRQLGGGADVLQMDYVSCSADGARRQIGNADKIFGAREIITGREYTVNHFRHHNGFWNLWSRVYNTAFIRRLQIPVFEKYVVEDFLFNLYWGLEDCRVAFCDYPLVEYTAGREGSSTNLRGYVAIYGHLYASRFALDVIEGAALASDDRRFLADKFSRLFAEHFFAAAALPRGERKDLYRRALRLGGRQILRGITAEEPGVYPAARLWLYGHLRPGAARQAAKAAQICLECCHSALRRLAGKGNNGDGGDA